MDKNRGENNGILCPVGRFFLNMEEYFGQKSDFLLHMNKSRIEFLKGIRSLLDERIKNLEKRETPVKERKADRIKVD
jgi:hypothetical protein